MIETIRQGLKQDGFDVSISKLCKWFEVPRRTDQRLAGQKAAGRLQASNQGLVVCGGAAERTLGNGSVPDLGWT